MNMRAWLRRVMRPRVLLPWLLAAALLAAAIKLGDLGAVVTRLKAVPLTAMAAVLGCAAAYLLLKVLVWHWLVAALNAHPGWRRLWRAFAVGELALTLPLGVFAQNWVLSERHGPRFGRTSAATVVMLLLETLVATAWLAGQGVPAWPDVRLAAAIVVLALLAGIAMACLYRAGSRRWRGLAGSGHRLSDTLRDLASGLVQLAEVRVLLVAMLLAVAYLAALASAFFIMGRAMGVQQLDWGEAAGIYALALAAILVSGGLFGQIGALEIAGMGAARAWGFDFTDGLALMLGFRVAWTGAMWLLNGAVLLMLRQRKRPSR